MVISGSLEKGGEPDWNGLSFKMLRNSYKEENSHGSKLSVSSMPSYHSSLKISLLSDYLVLVIYPGIFFLQRIGMSITIFFLFYLFIFKLSFLSHSIQQGTGSGSHN